MIDLSNLWIVIISLGIGSFGLRFLFLGLIGNRVLPPFVLRHLRYTAVAVLPALVTPLVLWPQATGGEPDPARMAAALATLAVGVLTRSVIGAILTGGVVLYGMLYLLG
ncbi:AzlD domain-containing protein [Rhodobacteraceae bacterium LMO-12]|nr:AzlD domain-containing protein [Rhodobacteraceae bacterium LMO-JJ12]